MTRRIPQSFYLRSTLTVAKQLLGKVFVRRVGAEKLTGRIVEVEAYHQDIDEAAHSFAGRTKRNAVMYEPGGVLYVYFIYGMHYCMNVVTEAEGTGAAVLIRAIEPLEGLEIMRNNRGGMQDRGRDLTNGPAKCCQAFGITNAHNGIPLFGDSVFILQGDIPSPGDIVSSPRIGITKSVDLPWRFHLRDNPWISRKIAR